MSQAEEDRRCPDEMRPNSHHGLDLDVAVHSSCEHYRSDRCRCNLLLYAAAHSMPWGGPSRSFNGRMHLEMLVVKLQQHLSMPMKGWRVTASRVACMGGGAHEFSARTSSTGKKHERRLGARRRSKHMRGADSIFQSVQILGKDMRSC